VGFAVVLGIFSLGRPIQAVLDPGNTAATVGFGYPGVSPWAYALTQPGVVLRYLSLAIWPFPLCLDYRWPTAASPADYVSQAVALGLILLATLWCIVRRRTIAVIPVCYLVMLAPTSSFVPVKDALFEHRMYLPLACVVLAVVLGADSWWRSFDGQQICRGAFRRFAPVGVAMIAAVSLLWGTHRRNTAYHGAVAMWQDVVAKRPNNARAYEQLGTCLIRENRLNEAIDAYRIAVTVDPQFATSWANLGNALLQAGRATEAVGAFADAIRLDPRNVDMRINRAFALKHLGRSHEAIEEYRAAAQINDPSVPLRTRARAHYNLGGALLADGRLEEAVDELREAVRLAPDYEKAHHQLALARIRQGRRTEAADHLRRVLELNPQNQEARQALTRIQEPR
jgi:Flp pilus assembly protein TadD